LLEGAKSGDYQILDATRIEADGYAAFKIILTKRTPLYIILN